PVIPPHKRECGAWLILEASEFFLRMKLRVIPIKVFYPFLVELNQVWGIGYFRRGKAFENLLLQFTNLQ
uniref:hypothetical protein n=1 Tax=Spirulina sp. CCY15215 TaxID=2767591 RepID=UPI00194F38C2